MSDFSFVAPPSPPAQPIQSPTPVPTAAPAQPNPGAVVQSNVVPTQADDIVTPNNALQILNTVHAVVQRLVAVSHISEDEKRQHAAALTGATVVETAEERAAREERDAKRAELQRQIAELDQ